MSAAPTLINLPPQDSNPDTPSEMPGTPNSTTTSLSTLSTTAIKDGHRGTALPHSHHRQNPSTNTLEAERADRISRLAGLERVSTLRAGQTPGQTSGGAPQGQIPGYFDAAGNPVYTTKMSTVGSASATGSAGGRTTTWASGSVRGHGDDDTMSMSTDTNYRDIDDRDRFSAGDLMERDMSEDGMSEEGNASLVGFGEGAGSTVSGPTYGGPLTRSNVASPTMGRGSGNFQGFQAPGSSALNDKEGGMETAERIIKDRLDEGEAQKPALGTPDERGLGKFYFEKK